MPSERPTPDSFAVALEALVAEYGQKLNDNEVITALERQLTRAWADACEPQPSGLFATAPELLGALKRLLHHEIAHVGPYAGQACIAARAAVSRAEAA